MAENVADVLPAGTVTVAGTDTALLLEARFTVAPPEGAATSIVTVPVVVAPPIIEEGENETLTGIGGVNVNIAVTVPSGVDAVIVAPRVDATDEVVILNVPDAEPWGMVIDAGTDTDGLLDFRFTTKPAFAACPSRVIVPTEPSPPTTVEGASVRLVGAGALTVSTHVTRGPTE